MATSFQFNNQNIDIPGSYSTIKSGIQNPPVALPYGNVLMIDTGSGATWGGGSGVDGELTKGKDSIYQFDNIFDFRDFEKGGINWLLGQPLFRPNGLGTNGISSIFRIKAATTTCAVLQYDFDDIDTSASQAGSSLTIKITDEGIIGNGVITGNNLTKGFAGKISRGIIDTNSFIFTLFRGTYKGLDQNGKPFDGIVEADAVPIAVATSPEMETVVDLIEWMQNDANFKKFAVLTAYSVIGSGALSEGDKNYWASFNLAAGGTESYLSAQLLTDVLTACNDLDINFILCDQFGVNGGSAQNLQILTAAVENMKFKPEVYIAGGDNVNTYQSQSLDLAKSINNDACTVVHGAILKQSQQGLRTYSSIYHAAACVGREAGLAPQIPLTFKSLDFDGMTHALNDKEVKQALKFGVLVTRLEGGTFDIIKGINTLQKNTNLVNENGTTSSKQIKRISRQLNKEIKVQSREDLLKDEDGVNRNTLSTIDVEAWLAKYLTSKKAKPQADNLILGFQDIVVARQQDAYFITYKFEANSEISFLFFTGTLINL